MALEAGFRLGAYEILAPLGAGGMGEVYRARDTKLSRDVAIKILPDTFAKDVERVARFEREARLLAAVNHPHIAGIHGLEDFDGCKCLVLEFVDGQSLADRLSAGPLPVDEALNISRQLVDALEAAHDRGVIHRDLKPANIMLTTEGQVKVLDFGLAKQIDEAGLAGKAGGAGGELLTQSPTLSVGATQAGVILGTAAYMSPEQAKGRPADKRSDVWGFGCVLYEMLTGKRVFRGDDISDILAAILRAEPDLSALPSHVPPHIRTIIKRSLEKDRKIRIPDLSVVRFMMDAASAGPDTAPVPTGLATRQSAIAWRIATALLLLTLAAGASVEYFTRSRAPAVERFFVNAPEKSAFTAAATGPGAIARISPNGRKPAFTARDASGKTLLWVRPIDSLDAQPLLGTDDAAWPFLVA